MQQRDRVWAGMQQRENGGLVIAWHPQRDIKSHLDPHLIEGIKHGRGDSEGQAAIDSKPLWRSHVLTDP